MTATTAPVPDAYLGLWRRALLRTPEREDTTSTVFWLQTPRWHADIRVPVGRPTFAGVGSLAELDRPALLALAAQQGFAGITTVEADICRWHRRVDFQPPSGFPDVGRIVFETADRMLEHGVEQDYFEIWERVPGSTGPWAAVAVPAEAGTAWLLRSGAFTIRVRPRDAALAPAASLTALADNADDPTLRGWLDFEITFAVREGPSRWVVRHATLPWLEGHALAEGTMLETIEAGGSASAGGWRTIE